jgi:CubicO group peptidase (beta-lactamase class C family)
LLLHYPLTDRGHRHATPAGGLFSTAADLSRFCQMVLAGGVYKGKRYISAESLHEMTQKQITEPGLQSVASFGGPHDLNGYGLGWFTGEAGAFGHGGAYSTDMRIDPKRGIIFIWLVQHASFGGDGARSEDTFERFASQHFGSGVDVSTGSGHVAEK